MQGAQPSHRVILKDANLVSDAAEARFWSKSLGKAQTVQQCYLKYRRDAQIKRNVIFYETMSGDRMSDNPYALFRYIRSDPEYAHFTHVWSIGKHGKIPSEYRDLENVLFVRRGTEAYTYFLATAGYVISNANLPSYFTRRSKQQYLNTWHGVPYKALGRDVTHALFGTPSTTATFLKATHVITTCEFMTNALMSAYSMKGSSTALIAETGYPRVDLTLNASAESQLKIRDLLGIADMRTDRQQRPVVLYAPTWRSSDGQDSVDAERLTRDLQRLSRLDIQLMYRGHHRVGRLVEDGDIGANVVGVRIPPHEINTNELLSVVDILITDYSSVFFDFLPTGRPIVHYLYDIEEYAGKRGLNLETSELPGMVVRTSRELLDAVQETAVVLRNVVQAPNTQNQPVQGLKYLHAQRRFCEKEDGNATSRVVDFFLKNEGEYLSTVKPRDGRPTILFWAGRLDSSLSGRRFLTKAIKTANSTHAQTSLVIDRASPLDHSLKKLIARNKSRLATISYEATTPVLLAEETTAYQKVADKKLIEFEEVVQVLRENPDVSTLFSRLYKHRLDDATFDRVVLAPELAGPELALAAFSSTRGIVVRGAGPLVTRILGSIRSLAVLLLPRGSRRWIWVERVYRKIRKVVRQ